MCGGCETSLVLIWRFTGFSDSGRSDGLVAWKLVGSFVKPGVCDETSGEDEGCGSNPATGARDCSGVSSDGNGGASVWLGLEVSTKNGFMAADVVVVGWYWDEVVGMMNSGWGGGCGGK